MDNITHASLGIVAAVLTARDGLRRQAALAGMLAAELPDLDVLIFSNSDPLLGLQMHRYFSHSLLVIPLLGILGLLLANGIRKMGRRPVVWRGLWLPAIAAAATHGFCDTWTSYGTHLLWPFSERRESWDLISVIDPLLTLPLAWGAVLAWRGARRRPAFLAAGWVACYLGLCLLQQHRASNAVRHWAATQGHEPSRLTVKPSFGNIMVWRGLYVNAGRCQVVCVRPGITEGTCVLGVASVEMVEPSRPLPPLSALRQGSVQALDVLRFQHFSDDWLGVHPEHPGVIGDLRYATLPDRISPLWGIVIDPSMQDHHVKVAVFRRADRETWATLWRMITGTVRPFPEKKEFSHLPSNSGMLNA